jgi:GNAT superfamily N-acetyltransferase
MSDDRGNHGTSNIVKNISVVNTRPEHAEALGALQKLAFPNLVELMTPAHFRRHMELFPDGQFVALDTASGDKVVGSTSTFRTNFDFAHPQHKFFELIDNGWLTNHNPNGVWLYGADMMVHPDYRGRGIAKQLYAARLALVKRANLRGQIAGGMVPGYYRYADQMPVDTYIKKVVAGELTDPTLSMQLKMGFRYIETLYDHLTDESSGNAAALIVWDNPDYTP